MSILFTLNIFMSIIYIKHFYEYSLYWERCSY